ncbi:MAG TPA: ATP-binding cassette domain-containing protein [Edaphobacter sp.]|uniref:ATP-binding cassette domain-containing protein n=1 Tax=Edaphobacter sp. TaxID=1934404 RepID=UPI002D18A3B3|nr:ATP-binding cassette domain-containing protein [Edaphobacter sp.]HUZ95006.1 ATP-binding cassette domain-containing protein [Edaphobacter sp.]
MGAIVVRNLSKSFGKGTSRKDALKNISFEIAEGSMTALIGPDGAGKTTLLRLLAGILQPDSGDLRVLGHKLPGEALQLQARIGYMPQRFGLYENLTVEENLTLFADLHNIPDNMRKDRFDELLTMTALGPFRKRRAGQLSGGMKQKLGLACTLIHPPQLLLLDEASVGVDPISRRELWSIIRQQVAHQHVTVLLSTAYMDEAERCDHVILLHEGEILAQGNPSQLVAPMEGHSFLLEEISTGPRNLQSQIARLPGVVDTAIQGDGLRIVMEKVETPPLPANLAIHGPSKPVAARLEDAFVSLLFKRTPHHFIPLPPLRNSTGDDAAVVEVRSLSRYFGAFAAVKDVSFSVHRGEIFGLLGANGAGKSTTFRMLCGLLPASSGTLRVAGADLRSGAAVARARIGYVSQKFSLYGALSVQQNLTFFANVYGLQSRRKRDRIAWALDELELKDYIAMNAAELPLGYKQRLALACALMHEPSILFLDEPTSGVDPLARREFWARVNALAEGGTTCLVTTHFMEEAEYCDRLVLMSLGEVLAEGTPTEIKNRVRRADQPNPSMEDAFISLIEEHERVSRRAS